MRAAQGTRPGRARRRHGARGDRRHRHHAQRPPRPVAGGAQCRRPAPGDARGLPLCRLRTGGGELHRGARHRQQLQRRVGTGRVQAALQGIDERRALPPAPLRGQHRQGQHRSPRRRVRHGFADQGSAGAARGHDRTDRNLVEAAPVDPAGRLTIPLPDRGHALGTPADRRRRAATATARGPAFNRHRRRQRARAARRASNRTATGRACRRRRPPAGAVVGAVACRAGRALQALARAPGRLRGGRKSDSG